MKVSNNKPFALRYKSHTRDTISIPKQFITYMYSRGNASPKACWFWRLQTARSVPATSLSRPTQLFVHSRACWRLRANTSRRINRCSGWYHPRRMETHHTSGEPEHIQICRFSAHSDVLLWDGGISWQRFGGAPQAGAAERTGRVFRHRQAVWPASIHVLLSTIESSTIWFASVDCEFDATFSREVNLFIKIKPNSNTFLVSWAFLD